MTSEIDINSWEMRIESKLGDLLQIQHELLTEQAVIKEQITQINTNMDMMRVDQQESFERIRALEQKPPQCKVACENRDRVAALERNQRWGVVTILTGVMGMLLWHFKGGGM